MARSPPSVFGMNREYTGNSYIFVPHIGRHDGAIRAINIVHRGLDGIVEWRAARDVSDAAEPLLHAEVRVDGAAVPLGPLQLERLDGWIPRFESQLGADIRLAMTICAPAGYEALARGTIIRFELENRGAVARTVDIALSGNWAWTLHCIGSTRPLRGDNRLIVGTRREGFALEAGGGGTGAALAVACGVREPRLEVSRDDGAFEPVAGVLEREAPNGTPLHFRIGHRLTVAGRRRASMVFAIAGGQERDGALHTARRLAAQDAGRIIQDARIEATRIGRRTSSHAPLELIRRNLLFAVYAGTARAIDDDRLYPVASRVLDHGPCAVVDEHDVLLGTMPALTLAEPFLARELLLRMFELYSDRAGTHLRYLSGGVLAPGFSLARFCAYVHALDSYVRDAADPSLAAEPLVQDVIREMDDWLWGRLHRDIFLGITDVGPGGDPPEYPVTTVDNVRAWLFCKGLGAHWQVRDGEPPARFRDAADELAAAIWQHCVVQHDGAPVFAGSVDLAGNAAIYDDPEGSLRWLPHLGFCDIDDPVWTNTLELFHSSDYPLWRTGRVAEGLASRDSGGRASFAALCADLVTGRRERALEILSRLDLPGGIACRTYDTDSGEAADGPWSAAHAGLLAWTLLRDPAAARLKVAK